MQYIGGIDLYGVTEGKPARTMGWFWTAGQDVHYSSKASRMRRLAIKKYWVIMHIHECACMYVSTYSTRTIYFSNIANRYTYVQRSVFVSAFDLSQHVLVPQK